MKTFVAQTLPFAVFSAIAPFILAAVCFAADTSIPIKISETYGETFRSLEVPENISVASPVFTTFDTSNSPAANQPYEVRQFPLSAADTNNSTLNTSTLQNLAPLQEGGRQRDRGFSDRNNNSNNNSPRPDFTQNDAVNSTEKNRGETKSSPPVFPSIPSNPGGTVSGINNAGTAVNPVFQSGNSTARFSKPSEERKGFSLAETDNRTNQPVGFGKTPDIAATLQDIFNTPLPLPQGTVDSDVIPKTLLPAETANTELTKETKTAAIKKTETKKEKEAAVDTKINGTLLVATVILVMTLVFVIVAAADYHHRWVQSLTTLNRRYTIPSSDNGWELAGLGGLEDYSTGADYKNEDLPSGFMYRTSYRNPL